VPDVKIVVTKPDKSAVGEATTGADGKYSVALPSPGTYILTLDESSLPKGVVVDTSANPTSRTVNVNPNQTLIGNFFLGKDVRATQGRFDLLLQTLVNGLKLSFIIAICSVGLSLIYGTTGLSNFAQGELVTLGAIVAWYVNQRGPKLHIILAALFGVAAAGLAGAALERGVWRPLRRRGTGLTSMMMVSIGLAIAARYLFQYYFGGRAKAYRQYFAQKAWDLGPVSIAPRDIVSILICLVVLIGVALFLLRTRLGKAVRAVSDNPDLSSATGINTDRIILIVWVLGAALAGLGGVLLGLKEQVRWDGGFGLLLLMFAAITLGGLGNPFGALVGSFAIGMFVELWTWVFPNVIELKTVGALIALIVLLLIRPQGILGRRERIG
jgi:branched-chain amino acid transport system permease protein